jgi:periplasmic protein TonB
MKQTPPKSSAEIGSAPGSESDAGGREPEILLGRALEQKPIWAGLYATVRDAWFAPKLPPLELTSTPIPAPDRLAVRTNPWAVGASALVNGGILAILLCLGLGSISRSPKPRNGSLVDLEGLNLFSPLKAQSSGGGGGGGAHDLMEPIKGSPPKVEVTPVAPPQIPLFEHPKLAVDPAVAAEINLPENPSIPNLGVPNSANVTLASNGPGGMAGIGTDSGGGDGPGHGYGSGPGEDRGAGGQIFRPGVGGVTAPIPLFTPEAEFSDQARRAKYQGVCLISVIIDAQGHPRSPRVVESLGMGLDEKVLEAVLKYRFKPAMRAGRPVAVLISVQVNFRLY